jgi:biotin operon repressor/anti-sigma regulatory factor (Ser/Thr protein kinase)
LTIAAVASPPSTRDAILAYLDRRGSATSTELAHHLSLTRQAINLHLRRLIDSGEIVKTGSTRGARYFPASATPETETFAGQFALRGLDEAEIYDRVAVTLNLARRLRPNVRNIVHYAFTEMLNNAIEHSRAGQCRVKVGLEAARLAFEVRETGIGIFRSIADKYRLPDEHAAMIELVKGKTTTMPESHSGEGIFFTCRAADRMVIRSHGIQIEWNRARDDVFVSAPRFRKGTSVLFQISRHSRTRLEDVFAEFAPEAYDYQFRKTRVLVKLLQREYVSRSEAKRLLLNLDEFAEIEFDLRDVKHLGQGFADEIFRVFASRHPDIQLRAINTNDSIAAMVRHAGGRVA